MSNSNRSQFYTSAHPGSAQQSQRVEKTTAVGGMSQSSTTMKDRPAGAEGGETGTGAAPEHQEQGIAGTQLYLKDDPCVVQVSFNSTTGVTVHEEKFELLRVYEWRHIQQTFKLLCGLKEELNKEGIQLFDSKTSGTVLKMSYTGKQSDQGGWPKKLAVVKKILQKASEEITQRNFYVSKEHIDAVTNGIEKNKPLHSYDASIFRFDDLNFLVVTKKRISDSCFDTFAAFLNNFDVDGKNCSGGKSDGFVVLSTVALDEQRLHFLHVCPMALDFVSQRFKSMGHEVKFEINDNNLVVVGSETVPSDVCNSVEEDLKTIVCKKDMQSNAIFTLYTIEEVVGLVKDRLLQRHCKFTIFKGRDDSQLILMATNDDFHYCETEVLHITKDVEKKEISLDPELIRKNWRTFQSWVDHPTDGRLDIQRKRDGKCLLVTGTSSAMQEFVSKLQKHLPPEKRKVSFEMNVSGVNLMLLKTSEGVRTYTAGVAKKNDFELRFDLDKSRVFLICEKDEITHVQGIFLSLFETIDVSLKDFESLQDVEELLDIIKSQHDVHQGQICFSSNKRTLCITGTTDVIPAVKDFLQQMKRMYKRSDIYIQLSSNEMNIVDSEAFKDIISNEKLCVSNFYKDRASGLQVKGAHIGVQRFEKFIKDYTMDTDVRSETSTGISSGDKEFSQDAASVVEEETETVIDLYQEEPRKETPMMKSHRMDVSVYMVSALKENPHLRDYLNQHFDEEGYLINLSSDNLDIYAGSKPALTKAENFFHKLIFEVNESFETHPVFYILPLTEISQRLLQKQQMEKFWLSTNPDNDAITIIGSRDNEMHVNQELETLRKMYILNFIDLARFNLRNSPCLTSLENVLSAEPRLKDTFQLSLDDKHHLRVVAHVDTTTAVNRKLQCLLQRLVNLQSFDETAQKKCVPLSQEQLALVQKPEVMEHIDTKLIGFHCKPDLKSRCMLMCTTKWQVSQDAVKSLSSCFKERTLYADSILKAKNATLDELESMLINQENVHEGKLYVKAVSDSALRLVCTDDVFEKVLSYFDTLQKNLSQVTEHLDLGENEVKYMKKFCHEGLNESLQQQNVQMNYLENGLELIGQKSGVDSIKESISEISKRIITKGFPMIEEKEIVQSREGLVRLLAIEDEKRCVISGIVCSTASVNKWNIGTAKQILKGGINELYQKCIPRTKSSISIIQGKLYDYMADVLVIPAVDGKMPDAVRTCLQQGSGELTQLPKDEKCNPVWLPCPEGMNYGKVALCSMPSTLKDGSKKEKDTIRKTIKSVLKMKSLSHKQMPASSVHICLSFENKSTSKITKHILKGVAEACSEDEQNKLHVSVLLEEIDKNELSQMSDLVEAAVNSSMMNPLQKVTAKLSKKHETDRDRAKIKLFIAPLEKHEADVLVNSVSKEMDFSQGNISDVLNKETNGKLEKECKKLYPQNLTVARVAVTDSFGLRAKKVFHGNLNPFPERTEVEKEYANQCWKDMEYFITQCLRETMQRKLSSIAFPALGSGKLRYPQKELVPFIFNTVSSFLLRNSTSPIKEVHFVLHPSATEIIQLFYAEDMAHNYCRLYGASPRRMDIGMGSVMVQVLESSISQCDGKSDGLLCFWNSELLQDPSNHPLVGEEINNMQFSRYETELRCTSFTMTLGGSLPATRVLHVMLHHNDLNEAFLRVFQEAVKHKICSVQVQIESCDAFKHASIVADSIWRSVTEATVQGGPLCLVTVLVNDPQYSSHLAEKLNSLGQESTTGIMSQVLNKAKGFLVGTFTKKNAEAEDTFTDRYFITAETDDVCSQAHELIRKSVNELKQRLERKKDSSVDNPVDEKNAISSSQGKKIITWKGNTYHLLLQNSAQIMESSDELEDLFQVHIEDHGSNTYMAGELDNIVSAWRHMSGASGTDQKHATGALPKTSGNMHETNFISVQPEHLDAVYHLFASDLGSQVLGVEDDTAEHGLKRINFKNTNKADAHALQLRIQGIIREELPIQEADWNKAASAAEETMKGLDGVYLTYKVHVHTMILFAENWDTMAKAKRKVELQFGQGKTTSRGNRRFGKRTVVAEKEPNKEHGVPQSDEGYTLKGKLLTVKVYKADITALSVDVIVNAANGQLRHGGGVARAIAAAAGSELREEGNKIVAINDIPVTELAVTTAGNINSEKVFHAVGPRWTDYKDKDKCRNDLRETILRCLCAARNLKFTSIAFPSVSAAIFGVPQDICAMMYAQALKSFDTIVVGGSLNEVHFVDITDTMVNIIQEKLQVIWHDQSTTEVQKKDEAFIHRHLGTYIGMSSSQIDPSNKKHGMRKVTDDDSVSPGQHDHNEEGYFKFSDSVTINIFQQNLFEMKANALVSWEDKSLYEGRPLTKALIKAGGQSYEAERRKMKSKVSNTGDVIETGGGELFQEFVFHAVLETNIEEQKFAATLRKVLGMCVKKQCSSVLVPVYRQIAAGPRRESLRIFMELVVDSLVDLARHSARPKLHVHIVEREQQVVDNLTHMLHQYLTSCGYVNSSTDNQKTEASGGEQCVICLSAIVHPKKLKCGHTFCTECIDNAFKHKKMCPTCKAVCGVITGNMPPGYMNVHETSYKLPGYEECGSLTITYTFYGGYQKEEHPDPGTWYAGITRRTYLPNNAEGQKVLSLLKVAWDRRLTFTIGRSVTMGRDSCVTWNEIHHKTSLSGGPTNHGYPDPDYLRRVQEELAAQGVTEEDLGATGSIADTAV